MGTMTETGTEKRVDELSKRVDFGFDVMSKRMDFGFEQTSKRMDLGFALLAKGAEDLRSEMRVNHARIEADVRELRSDTKAGFDSLNRLMIRFFAGTVGSIVAGVVVLLLSHS